MIVGIRPLVERHVPMVYVILLLIVGVLCVVAYLLMLLVEAVNQLTDATNDLRLSGRTVQRQAVMRNGQLSEERVMTRLGRSTKARRVVVGGEEDSQLRAALQRGVEVEDDDSDDQ